MFAVRVVLLLTASAVARAAADEPPHQPFQCSLYVAKSRVLLGRGVFAGRNFSADDIVDHAPTLAVVHDDISETMLNNYVFATDEEEWSMLEFGPGSALSPPPHHHHPHPHPHPHPHHHPHTCI